MNYECELHFFLDILEKCHIHTAVVGAEDSFMRILDPQFAGVVGLKSDVTVGQALGEIESNTKYKFSNEFKFRYVYIRLPGESEKSILSIGPYVSSVPSSQDILEIAEQAGVPIEVQKSFTEYYLSLPVLSEGDRLFVMLDAF